MRHLMAVEIWPSLLYWRHAHDFGEARRTANGFSAACRKSCYIGPVVSCWRATEALSRCDGGGYRPTRDYPATVSGLRAWRQRLGAILGRSFRTPDCRTLLIGAQPRGLNLRAKLKSEMPLAWADQTAWFEVISRR